MYGMETEWNGMGTGGIDWRPSGLDWGLKMEWNGMGTELEWGLSGLETKLTGTRTEWTLDRSLSGLESEWD